MNEILTPEQVAGISGPEDDTSRSLDAERQWFSTPCTNCSVVAHLAVPDPEANTEAVEEAVEVTLPDGSTTEVELVHAVPRSALRWECGSCDTIQDVELPGGAK